MVCSSVLHSGLRGESLWPIRCLNDWSLEEKPDRSWDNMVLYGLGRDCSSGEMFGGGTPNTLFGDLEFKYSVTSSVWIALRVCP